MSRSRGISPCSTETLWIYKWNNRAEMKWNEMKWKKKKNTEKTIKTKWMTANISACFLLKFARHGTDSGVRCRFVSLQVASRILWLATFRHYKKNGVVSCLVFCCLFKFGTRRQKPASRSQRCNSSWLEKACRYGNDGRKQESGMNIRGVGIRPERAPCIDSWEVENPLGRDLKKMQQRKSIAEKLEVN